MDQAGLNKDIMPPEAELRPAHKALFTPVQLGSVVEYQQA
jgi:hypothetical protein